jgi:predicted phage terminase large subunit-like protein
VTRRLASSWTPQRIAPHLWRTSPARTAERLSGGRWRSAAHLALLDREIRGAIYSEAGRVAISLPPRHGKSELIDHWLPVWYLDRWPDREVILATHSAELSVAFSRRVRDTIHRHADQLRVRISPSSSAAHRWRTTAGGGMRAVGVGGSITGEGAHLLLLDDLLRGIRDAYSPAVREATWRWYATDARTRLAPGGAVVAISTRWHEDDPIGRLRRSAQEDGEPWRFVALPAYAGEGDPLGRELGAALWPGRWPLAELRRAEKVLGPVFWAALYQQEPVPAGMRLLPREGWARYLRAPAPGQLERIVQSWDLSFGADSPEASYVVGQVWGVRRPRAYLLDQVRGQWGFRRTVQEMLELRRRWPSTSETLVENKANGPAIMDALGAEIPGLEPVEPRGSKLARAAAVQPFVSSRHVIIPAAAPWLEGLLEEAHAFPGGATDDQVDALSQALDRIYLSGADVLSGLAGAMDDPIAGLLQESTWRI